MEFLYLLEKIRNPIFNKLMLAITTFGEETAFLVVALIIFWCVDKNRGYYVMVGGFFGNIVNQFLKILCRVPRPWILDENFTIVEEAREAASGYSFPSGHSQTAVGTFGSLAATEKNRVLRWIFIVVACLVPFSRMYLGVHTPTDVLVGAGCALVMIFAFRFVNNGKFVPLVLGVLTAFAAAFVAFVEFFPFSEELDAANYASAVKFAYTLFGAVSAMLLVYFIDTKWVDFSVKAVWWAQILKVVLGLLLVLAVKSGLKTPLNSLLGNSWGTAVRYFLVVMAAGALWPLSFRWFSKLGKKGI